MTRQSSVLAAPSRGVERSPSRWSVGLTLALVAAITGLGLAAGRLATGPTTWTLAVAGLAVGVLVSARLPELSLAIGATLTLCGGAFAGLAQVGQLLLLLAASMLLIRIALNHEGWLWLRHLALPGVLIVWLGARLLLGTGFAATRPLAACLAAVVLMLALSHRTSRIAVCMSVLGVAFYLATYQFGVTEPGANRFAGISGNPNRMVFGLLVFAPFLASTLVASRHVLVRLLMLGTLVLGFYLITLSGSEQGAVGIWVLAAAFAIHATRRLDAALVVVMILALAVISLWVAIRLNLWENLSLDARTLSGRTVAYDAGYRQLTAEPIFGSGDVHVSTTLGVDLSAHNSTIGVAATAGILAGIAWLLLLLRAVVGSVSALRQGVLYAATGIVVVVSQLVQSIEYIPIAWVCLVLPACIQQQQQLTLEREGGPDDRDRSRVRKLLAP